MAQQVGALAVSLLLTACGGGAADSSSASSAAPNSAAASQYGVTQTQAEIAALLYSDSQRTPLGFTSESLPVFEGYIATTQLKTQDINPSAVLRYELCSDDYQQALTWSDTANSLSGDQAALTGTDITERFFEFDRLKVGTPNGLVRQRVYKCSYLNRATVDLTAAQGPAGILNARPLDAALLKTVSEYLWQFTPYNNTSNAVLVSQGGSANNSLLRTLVIASLTPGSSGACDTIALRAWQHALDLTTGELMLSVTTLSSFGARQLGGNISVCAG